jgi:hypothetical protein
MTTSLNPIVAVELTKLERIKAYLSPNVVQAIEARLTLFTKSAVRSSSTALRKPKMATTLVRRPGLPPRPLDPFFFEVVQKPARYE